jgi:hypothetical protein
VLAVVPPGNDARRIVDETACGWGVDPGDAPGVERVVRTAAAMSPNVLAGRGDAARECFERFYSLDICARQFEAELLRLSSSGGTQAVPAVRPR